MLSMLKSYALYTYRAWLCNKQGNALQTTKQCLRGYKKNYYCPLNIVISIPTH